MKNEIELTREIIRKVQTFFAKTPWNNLYSARLEQLADKVLQPCELAVAGRMNSGKSQFLNAILGRDLAVVGNLETTATINYFKYGKPQDDRHPVLVVWEDGRREWQTEDFLNGLQGHNPDVLKTANSIDHLEYFVDDEVFKYITLIDTPGTDAVVDEHTTKTQEYFDLRRKHSGQTVRLKERADAVIIMVGHVQKQATEKIISEFTDGTSAFNAIGIMSKIDNEPEVDSSEWQTRCKNFAEKTKESLNTIVPVSAALSQTLERLKKEKQLERIQQTIRLIPEESGLIEDLELSLTIKDKDVLEELAEYGVNKDTVSELLGISPIYTVFYRIIKELYYNDIDTAIKNLEEYSGMEEVRNVLQTHFFDRAHMIRCAGVLDEITAILNHVRYTYIEKQKRNITYKKSYHEIISYYKAARLSDRTYKCGPNGVPYVNNDICYAFSRFIDDNITTLHDYDSLVAGLEGLINDISVINRNFQQADNRKKALMLLTQVEKDFNKEELNELEVLFGKYSRKTIDDLNIQPIDRYRYWNGEKQLCTDENVLFIIKQALVEYSLLVAK